MTAAAAAGFGLVVAGASVLLLTPLAARVSGAIGFLDHPREYRQHAAATPLLGGTAVIASVLLAGIAFGWLHGKMLVVVTCALAMWLVGTVDDRIAVPPKWRVLLAAGAAVALYGVGLGWDPAGGWVIRLALTVAWVVGLVNAFNLMDNMDGACATVSGAVAAGIGTLAAIEHEAAVAGLAFALCGACLGFLRWNLARPAKIFLGDGGSMPIGFLAAALAMAVSRHAPAGNAGVLVGAMLVGLPILDVTLVSLSRTRRQISVLTGGRDHLTHRLLLVLRTPRRVAVALAGIQTLLCLMTILGYELGATAVFVLGLAALLAGACAVVTLDRERWRPPGIARGAQQLPPHAVPEGTPPVVTTALLAADTD